MKITITRESLAAAAKAFEEEYLAGLMLNEGIHDPGILKCIFLAGGPGSGKSYASKELFGVDNDIHASMSSFGLKVVSSDIAFEYMMDKHGIKGSDLYSISQNDPDKYASITGSGKDTVRSKAKRITDHQKALYLTGKLGMIIDGTGENFDKMRKQREDAHAAGYDTFMVFIDVPLAVTLANNRKRGEDGGRRLPDDFVETLWNNSQVNKHRFGDIFGHDNYVVIEKTDNKTPLKDEIRRAVNNFLRRPIHNNIGRQWMQVASAYTSIATSGGSQWGSGNTARRRQG